MSDHPAARRGGGFIQDHFDERDHYYVPQSTAPPPPKVNLREDHAQLATMIYDQGQTGSCTANAAAAAFWYEEKAGRRAATWGAKGPSRLFIYWLARLADRGDFTANHDIPNVSDSGSMIRNTMKGLSQVGACPEDDWPFSVAQVNTKPSDASFNDAPPHKITSYYRLDPDRPDADDTKLQDDAKAKIGATLLQNVKKCLSEGFPVAFGFWYYMPENEMFVKTQKPWTLADPWTSKYKFPRNRFPSDLPAELKFFKDDNGDVEYPGHAVLIVGYDDSKGAVLVQNSWGASWSGNGTFWMPYSWITDFAATNDFWTIRTTHTAPAGPAKTWKSIREEIFNPSA